MGLLDFFSDKPNQKNIDKLVLRVKERYAQPEYRREAMDKLLAWGTPEAFAGVLQRFTVVAQSPHWDEEEKRWLVDELAARADPARSALRIFLARHDSIAFAAKALARLTKTKDELLDELHDALRARPPEDHRTTQGKAELIAALADMGDARVVAWVLPYVEDHADDVQVATIDCLEQHLSAQSPVCADAEAALKKVVADDGRSARVLRHAAAMMSRKKIGVDPSRALAPAVAEDYAVKDGLLVGTH